MLKTKSKKFLLFKIGASILLLFIILAFFIVPPLTKQYIIDKVSHEIQRKITVKSISFNPLTLGLTIEGFSMFEPSGDTVFFSFDKLYTNLEAFSVFKRAIVISEMKLIKPYLHITREGENRYNFSDILSKHDKIDKDNSESVQFSINNIGISEGKVVFNDKPLKITHNLSEFEMRLPFISNMPHFQESNLKPYLKAKINDKTVVIEGVSKPFSKSIETDVALNLKDIDIPFYLSYLPEKPPFILNSGLFSSDIRIKYIQYQDKRPSLKITGNLSIAGLSLSDLQKNKIFDIKKSDIVISDSDLISRHLNIQNVTAESPEVYLSLDNSGELNITKLFTKKKDDDKKFVFEIDNIQVNKGGVYFHDKIRAFKKSLADIEFNATHISNKPDISGTFSSSMVTNTGETIYVGGKVNTNTLAVDGDVKLSGIILKDYAPYYKEHINAVIKKGIIDISGKFLYSSEQIRLYDFFASLKSFVLSDNDGDEIVSIPNFTASDLSLDYFKKQINLGSIEGKNARLSLVRDDNGLLNLEGIIANIKPEDKQTEVKKDNKEWTFNIKDLRFQGFDVRFHDLTTTPPVEMRFKDIAFKGRDIGNKKQQKGRLGVSMTAQKSGKVSLDTSVMVNPLNFEGVVKFSDFDLTTMRGYLYERMRVSMPSGNLNLKGGFFVKSDDKNEKVFSYSGQVSLRQIHLLDNNISEDLLKWGNLNINDISIKSTPFTFSAKDISLSDFYSRLSINKDKRINLQDIIIEKPTENTVSAETVVDKDEKKIVIGAITLQNGAVYFTDRHVEPNFSAKLTELTGSISGLTSMEEKPADIDIRGIYEETAPLFLSGKINPFKQDLYLELKADFKNMGMHSLNPYSTKYLGYTIDKGNLSFEVKYYIDKGSLDAENNIFLNQLTLGDKVESPDATKLPVKLAIALLKDKRGEIKLDLPVKGSLKDPDFSIGGIVVKMIINLLLKVATSPFALLGAMFGGSEEMSYVDFDYGSPELRQDQMKKIDTLIKAITERPALKLNIKGFADLQKDKEGIKNIVLQRKIKSKKLKEIIDSGQTPPALHDIVIEPQEYEKYLTEVYKTENFPKPRNIIGMLKKLPPLEMEKLILSHIPVTDSDLRQLANDRASAVLKRIKSAEGIGAERLFMSEGVVLKDDAEKKNANRVEFTLN